MIEIFMYLESKLGVQKSARFHTSMNLIVGADE